MGRIFLSYRHADAQGTTDHISAVLKRAFGRKVVFCDPDIIPGDNWKDVLISKLAGTTVLLVIIGPRWVHVQNSSGQRRLDDPNDPVRFELEWTSQRNTARILPVLVEHALLPSEAELPKSLKCLLDNQAITLRPGRDFKPDVHRLVHAIDPWRVWRRACKVACGIALLLALAVVAGRTWLSPTEKLAGSAGEWLYDQHVAVRIREPVRGRLFSTDNYVLEFECRNMTTMDMYITRIVSKAYNDDLTAKLGRQNPLIHESRDNVTRYVAPGEVASVPIRLNQLLPKSLAVSVQQSQTPNASRFEVDLLTELLPPGPARFLRRSSIYQGVDCIDAINRSVEDARRWSEDATVAAAIPGPHQIRLDRESGLMYYLVESWIITYRSNNMSRDYICYVDARRVESGEMKLLKDDTAAYFTYMPQMSSQVALDIANRSSVLSDNWNSGPVLGAFQVGEEPVLAWLLPYLTTNGFPLIIDAANGDSLLLAPSGGFRRIPLQPVGAPEVRTP